MAANPPVTSPAALIPGVDRFLTDIRARFVPGRYGKLDDKDFLDVFELAAQVFADWRHLNVKRVKGATYPVPYTDSLGLVPADYRILDMQAEAVNGVDSATGAAGVSAPPVFFALIKDSAGALDALLDAEPTTVLTVKARWVRISGPDDDILASFEPLELEDHDYAAGDVRTYVFPNGATRLVQWRADSVGFTHPVPTGLDSDPIYAIFAPITPAGGGSSPALPAFDPVVDEGKALCIVNGVPAWAVGSGVGTPRRRMAVVFGDSISAGYGLPGYNGTISPTAWPALFGTATASKYGLVVNMGRSGYTTQDVRAFLSTITAQANFADFDGVDYYFLVGVNNPMHLSGATVASTAADFPAIVAALKAANPAKTRVYQLTLPAGIVTGNGYVSAFQLTEFINDLNITIRRHAVADWGVDAVLDLSRDVRLQQPDATYYQNEAGGTVFLHPNAAGAPVIAEVVAAFALTGAQPTGPLVVNLAPGFVLNSGGIATRTGFTVPGLGAAGVVTVLVVAAKAAAAENTHTLFAIATPSQVAQTDVAYFGRSEGGLTGLGLNTYTAGRTVSSDPAVLDGHVAKVLTFQITQHLSGATPFRMWVNGVEQALTSSGAQDTTRDFSDLFILGSGINPNSYLWDAYGDIGTAVLYLGALADADRAYSEAGLKAGYQVP